MRNDRLIVRPAAARREAGQKDVADIPERVRAEIAQFLLASTVLENKDVRILGWDGPGAVVDLIRSSIA